MFDTIRSATGDMLGPVTTDMVIDYDDVNTLFTTEELNIEIYHP